MNKKQLKALLASASQTDFKPEIEGILCKIQGDKVTLVTTNAFILNIVTIDNEPIIDFSNTDTEFIIAKQTVNLVIKTMAPTDRIAIVHHAESDFSMVQVIDQKGKSKSAEKVVHEFKIDKVNGTYPDYAKIIPEQGDWTELASMNLGIEQLITVSELHLALGFQMIDMVFTANKKPIMIDNNRGNIEIKSLIMPASK